MKLLAPAYYNTFKCIANACRHNCCIGWEIDIDADTLALYNSLDTSLGNKLRNNISIDPTPHFILDSEQRCPFLDSSGLCNIICEMGEEALCDICTDHPRFRNFFSDRTEIGLGLCCEEAARIIMSYDKELSLIILEDDGADVSPSADEVGFYEIRDKAFSVICTKEQSVSNKIEQLCEGFSFDLHHIDTTQWAHILSSLEVLSPDWLTYLNSLKAAGNIELCRIDDIPFPKAMSNLLHYFVYRHASDFNDKLPARIAFAALSTILIASLYITNSAQSFEEFVEIARMYSSEIEYSDENLSIILDILANDISVEV